MKLINSLEFLFKRCATYFILYVTARCNARCNHCYYVEKINNASKNDEMNLDEYRKFSAHLGKIKAISITGGEPTLREDLVDICEIFNKNNKVEYIGFHTNGSLFEKIKKFASELLIKIPETFFTFELSIDGLSNLHDKIRNTDGLFEKNLELIRYLASLKKKYTNFAIGVTSVYSNRNGSAICDIYNYFKKLPIDAYNVNLIRGNINDVKLKDIKIDEFDDAVNNICTYNEFNNSTLPLASFMGIIKKMRWKAIRRIIQTQRMPLNCTAGRKMLVISETAEVYPCELLGKSFGNLRDFDYNVKTILNLDRTKRILKSIRKKECCCTWECAITNSIINNPFKYPEIICSWLVDALKKKFLSHSFCQQSHDEADSNS